MRYAYLLLAVIALSAGVSAQGSGKPSALSVLEYKWKASPPRSALLDSDPFTAKDDAPQTARDQKIADRANPERIRRNEPLLVPTRRNTTPTDLPSDRYIGATFTYQIKVENTGAQTVQEVVWEYAFLDPASGKVLRSMTFQTEAKIKPGERDTLKETSRTLPPFLAAAPAGERITVKSVRYSDGTVWKADPK